VEGGFLNLDVEGAVRTRCAELIKRCDGSDRHDGDKRWRPEADGFEAMAM
jgi:hypothetical protein